MEISLPEDTCRLPSWHNCHNCHHPLCFSETSWWRSGLFCIPFCCFQGPKSCLNVLDPHSICGTNQEVSHWSIHHINCHTQSGWVSIKRPASITRPGAAQPIHHRPLGAGLEQFEGSGAFSDVPKMNIQTCHGGVPRRRRNEDGAFLTLLSIRRSSLDVLGFKY